MFYLSIFKKKIKIILIYISFFLIADIIFSNFIYKNNFKNNCVVNKEKFYYLEKNCNFKQKYIRNSPAYNVFTNNFGNRYSKKKYDKNKKNIFYFGDSFTYGLGLKYEKTYVGLVEKEKINLNHFNFGLQGYSPSVYLYQLNKMLSQDIIPSKIFLGLDFTDIFDEIDRWDYEINNKNPILKTIDNAIVENNNKKDDFKYKNFKGTIFASKVINNFFRNLKLYYKKKTKKFATLPGYTEMGSFLYLDQNELNEGIKKAFNSMSLVDRAEKLKNTVIKISELAEKAGSDFYILIYPWPDTLQYGQKSFNWVNYSTDICSKANCKKLINTCDSFNEIKNSNKDWLQTLFIFDDLHFNEFGNSIIAKEILKEF